MARPKNNNLTDTELEIMRILWNDSPLKVAEVLEKIQKSPKPAYTSLMTVLQTMVQKKYLEAKKVGKAYHYSPLIQKDHTFLQEFKKISRNFFNGSHSDLVMNLVNNEELTKEEIKEIQLLLEKKL